MLDNVIFKCGEKKYVSICVKSVTSTPFELTNAQFSLMCGDDEEQNGVCKIEEVDPTKVIVRALIQPMRQCATYKLTFSYDISPEHLMYTVNVITM